jgi:hypothetical protein
VERPIGYSILGPWPFSWISYSLLGREMGSIFIQKALFLSNRNEGRNEELVEERWLSVRQLVLEWPRWKLAQSLRSIGNQLSYQLQSLASP